MAMQRTKALSGKEMAHCYKQNFLPWYRYGFCSCSHPFKILWWNVIYQLNVSALEISSLTCYYNLTVKYFCFSFPPQFMNTITTKDFKFQGLNLKMPAILPAHDLSCFLSLLLLEKFGNYKDQEIGLYQEWRS